MAELFILPAPGEPMAVARHLLDEFTVDDDLLTLRYWRGGWMRWTGPHWIEVEPAEVRAELYRKVENAYYLVGDGKLAPWAPTKHKITDLAEATGAIVHLPASIDAPTWIAGEDLGGSIVAVQNGLLHVPTRKLLDHTPRFFNLVSVPFSYDPAALEEAVDLAVEEPTGFISIDIITP
jgi:putative DNA primase/helicase